MSLAYPFDSPFYTSTLGGSTVGVPHKFDIALAGTGYMLDMTVSPYRTDIPNWGIQTVSLIRGQSDTSKRPGEQTLNPEALWRRSAETWSAGAGQTWYDRDFSDDGRFRTSKGIDPWTRGQISLLPDTTAAVTSANTTVLTTVAGSYAYLLDGNTLKYSTDLASWTTVTAAAATLSSPSAIATDGHAVWACDANNLYYTNRAGSTYTPWHSSAHPCSLVRYAKGRILTVNGQAIYNNAAIPAQAPPTAFYTHPNTDWTWTDITEGPAAIYLSGYSGGKSLIYRTAVRTDGTTLDAPIVAGELPDGETVRSIQGYLGFLLIGSDIGFRFATLDGSGNISALGDLVTITGGVRCFEPQDRYVWFGWSNYDPTSTGLGRIDLRTFNETAPAYASDLMATGQGTVLSVATFGTQRIFTVSTGGLYAQSTDLVPTGTITSGRITYGLADPKTAINLTTRTAAGAGSYTVALATDLATPVGLSGDGTTSANAAGGTSFPAPSNARGELFEVVLTLTRDPGNSAHGPTFTRWTLHADPASSRRLTVTVPLLLRKRVVCRNNSEFTYDIAYERQKIEALLNSRQIVSFQDGLTSRSVIVDDYEWQPLIEGASYTPDWQGTLIVSCKTV